MTAHANLGASSAKRWMNCPGSIALIAKLPKHEQNRGSKYAEEGSAAHALAEHCLSNDVFPKALIGWHVTKYGEEWKVETPQTRAIPAVFYEVTTEMSDAVGEFVNNVREEYTRLGKGAVLYLEERVYPLEDRKDDLFGTADVILHQPFGELVVRDYKHGAGVVVDVDHNEQLMYYGLGALRAVGGAAEVETVRVVIDQPRAHHADGASREFVIEPKKLEEWGDTLRAAADRTRDPKAPLAAGEWCRFCPAAGRCPEVRGAAQKAAKLEFAPVLADNVPTLYVPDDPEKLSVALSMIPVIDAWAREVEGAAQRELEAGGKVPGYKLVEKRANRAWTNEAAVLEALQNSAASEEDYMTAPKLVSPAQVEKITALGSKKERLALVEGLAHKPKGGLTIAKDTDERPAALPSVVTDFAGVPLDSDRWLD